MAKRKMSTTTQILFNSPALHSLKRDQLVKLCKIHSLKGSGKNKELIERLQIHAKTLPPDDPLSIATRGDSQDALSAADSEDEASSHSEESHASMSDNITRPSEQWEVVMDTIAEVDEETLRSNRGASDRQVDEFGTHTSKASVTSSLRAIATSLGLKRNPSKSDGTTSTSSSSHSSKDVVQSTSTLPTSDPSGEEPAAEPVPGQSNLQGLPASLGARLSLSQAPATTTIRLVSNPTTDAALLLSPPKLKAFATTFDLVPGTPEGTSSVPVWPCSPVGTAPESLYPSIPSFQGFGDLIQSSTPARQDNSDMDIDLDMPGGLAAPSIQENMPRKSDTGRRFNTGATPKSTEKPSAAPLDIFSPAPKPRNASARSRLAIPRSEPFIFGSPLPQHNMSNLQFRTAAQSVLDEMNKRLAEEGVEAVDADVLNNRQATTEAVAVEQESKGSLRTADMFDKIHQKGFDKMDSIASHYAARRGVQSVASRPVLSQKRKSSLVVKERRPGVPAARHRPNGSRVANGASLEMLPGDFGEEADVDDEAADRRMSKRPRVEREEPDAPVAPVQPDPEEEVQKQKEREAIRRRLEHNKAKRRSSMGRTSLGRAPPPKAKPARFGFFSSAKSLVQNVWNRGAGSRAPSNIPVSKPAQAKEETKAILSTKEAKKMVAIPGSSGAPPLGSQTRRTQSGSSNASVKPSASGRSTLAPPVVSGEGGVVTASRIWKSPTLPFNPPSSSSAANPRSSTITGFGQSSSKDCTLGGFSSLGRRTENSSRVSSMGANSNIKSSAANFQKQGTGIPRSRTTSTLMAPTASSLAKTNSNSRIPVPTASHGENSTVVKASTGFKLQLATSPRPGAASEQITNSPPNLAQSPRRVKIFSQPLSPPLACPPMSLTAAATKIGQVAKGKPSSSPSKTVVSPRSKVLPGRRPRISRSKVIAKLASQRAADAGSGLARAGGKVRSSTSAEAAGCKTRQSYAGARGGDILMSAKKRVRQSEQARRRSRAIASDGRRADND